MMFGGLPQGTQDAKVVQGNSRFYPIRLTPTGGFVVLANCQAPCPSSSLTAAW
jgi:hypothetical protein